MNTRTPILAACIGLSLVLGSFTRQAVADDFSFSGSFTADDDVQLFHFSVGELSSVTLRSYGYAGGVQANGNIVPPGGFDTILALFDSNGNLINQNDDDQTGTAAADPNTGSIWDALLIADLNPGDYTVSVMQYNNFANGPTLADGFLYTGQPSFTAALTGHLDGQFYDVSGVSPFDQRTNRWAFDVLNVNYAVPEPSSLVIAAIGAVALIAWGRGRTRRLAA